MRYKQLSNGVFAPKNRQEFGYSDGLQVEESLKQIVRGAKDRSTLSNELVPLRFGWVTSYHLSAQRAHLLRPLEHLLKGKLVLELGAGCGALTRFLGETARRVVALEGSEKRAEIAALRCADLDTVTIINDTIQELDVPQKFDVVTLIGVLEYARKYDKENENPELNILRIARRFLKPDGCLLLALENQLGMKYLAGSREDHVMKPFWGVHDLYDADSVVTFGRKELEELLFTAGFAKLDQLIPLPDYKFPVTVLHPGSFSPKGPSPINITPFLLNSLAYDRQHPSPFGFSLEAVAAPLVRNGLLQDLCNSFFFVASLDEQAEPLSPQVLVSHYGPARMRAFSKETLFVLEGDDVQVKRRYLTEEAGRSAGGIQNTIEPVEKYLKGRLLQEDLVRVLNTPGWSVQDLADWAAPWLRYLNSIAVIGEDNVKRLPSYAIDLTPANFFVESNGELTPFDTEWSFEKDETTLFSYVAIRGLYVSIGTLTGVSWPAEGVPTNLVELIMQVLGVSGIPIHANDVEFFSTEFFKLTLAAMGSRGLPKNLLGRELTVRRLG